jgi:hypothetical protein
MPSRRNRRNPYNIGTEQAYPGRLSEPTIRTVQDEFVQRANREEERILQAYPAYYAQMRRVNEQVQQREELDRVLVQTNGTSAQASSPDSGWSQIAPQTTWNGSWISWSGMGWNPNAGYVTSQPETMVTVNIPTAELPSDPFLSLAQQVVLVHARMTSAEIEADQIRQHIRHNLPADPRKDQEDFKRLRVEIAKYRDTIDQLRRQMAMLMLADEHIRKEIEEDPAYDSRNEVDA